MTPEEEQQLIAVVGGLVPATAQQVGRALGKLSVRLGELGELLYQADIESTDAIEAHDCAFDLKYVAEMEADKRLTFHSMAKAKARIATADLRMAMRVAERNVRHLERQHKTLDRRIDVGRTQAATVRSEHRALGYGGAA